MRSQTKTLPVRLQKPVAALGQRLAKARIARKISQQLMGERCGVGRTTIYKLEKGDASISIETLFRYLSVIGMDADIDRLVEVDQVGYDLALEKKPRPTKNGAVATPIAPRGMARKVPTFGAKP